MGSILWNRAQNNRKLLRDHLFWEIWNGKSTKFWNNSQQKIPKLITLPTSLHIQQSLSLYQWTQVVHCLTAPSNCQQWQTWRTIDSWTNCQKIDNSQELWDNLKSHRIRKDPQQGIIRWGHSTKGMYTLKQAYHITVKFSELPKDNMQNKIWKQNLWKKVASFLLLVAHNHILTWDNIYKRGFKGPFSFPLYKNYKKNMDHLLNSCSYSQEMRDKRDLSFHQSNLNHKIILLTLTNQREAPIKNGPLNCIWKLY